MNKLTCPAILAIVALLAIAPTTRAADIDEDGIDDALEQTLIDMYRPVLFFDTDQYIRPCSVEDYIRHSELIWRTQFQGTPLDIVIVTNAQLNNPNDPNSPLLILLEGGGGLPPSTTTMEPGNVGFRINVFNDFRDGPPGPIQPVGMYAHVVPLKGPLSYTDGPTIPSPPLQYQNVYLIQYWQFFPFNDYSAPLDGGDHEGDWMWIDLLVERECPYTLHNAVYHHHGDDHCPVTVLSINDFFNSRPFPLPCNPSNLARVPRCFLEANVHEWWPISTDGGECEFFLGFDNPSHDGQIGSMESQNVMNLGERFAPMLGIEPQLVMLFNGLWGHDCGIPNDPPGGPFRHLPPNYPLSPLMVAHVDPAAPAFSGQGLGSRYHPFSTLAGAIDGPNAIETGGRVLIEPGNYSGPHAFSRRMKLECAGVGSALIGQ